MRILLELANNVKYGLAERLAERDDVEKIYMRYRDGRDDDYKNVSRKIGKLEFMPVFHRTADGKLAEDLVEYPALGKDFLEQIMPYEATAIQIAGRIKACAPIEGYFEEKTIFLKFLRYWKKTLEERKIDLIFLSNVPHQIDWYSQYICAKVLGIALVMITPLSLGNVDRNRMRLVYSYGEDIGKMAENVKCFYEKLDEDSELELKGYYKDYFDKTMKDEGTSHNSKESRDKLAEFVYDEIWKSEDIRYPRIRYCIHNVKSFVNSIKKTRSLELYRNNKYDQRMLKRLCEQAIYKRYDMVTLQQYDCMAIEPDYEKKYILFCLHYQPEVTTLPVAGVFRDQYPAIQLLSRLTMNRNILIYVKEHFVQPNRSRIFWEEIIHLPNVRIIKTDTPNTDLIKNSIAVATLTGSISIEGALARKPVLTFGSGTSYKGLPGLFEIEDEEQGRLVIDKLEAGISISTKELKRYMYALQENTFTVLEQKTYVPGSPEYEELLAGYEKTILWALDKVG